MTRARIAAQAAAAALVLAACRDRGGEASAHVARPPVVDASASATASAPPVAERTPRRIAIATVESEWCVVEGLVSLDDETCAYLPPIEEGQPLRLLVYLHGITPPTKESPNKTVVQSSVLASARRAGAFAIVPRGRRNIGPEGTRDWWAWPTSADAHARLAKEIVAKIVDTKKKLEAAIGAPFDRTYLAGGSNGAYFVTALALRGDLDAFGLHVDGIGVLSGGALGGRDAASLARLRALPTYIGHGTYDEPVKRDARALEAVLARAGWPVRVAPHALSHGTHVEYLYEAFDFWASADGVADKK